jgi:hypothetical protein
MTYCEDCGCKVFGGRCVNCHEESYILDQYHDQGMKLPDEDSDFMRKVYEQEKQISKNQSRSTHEKRSI